MSFAEDRRAWEATIARWAAREASATARQRSHAAAHRARMRALGRCDICLVTPATEGRATCAGCRDRKRARDAARVTAGLCAACGVEPLVSAWRCVGCLRDDAARAATRAAEQRAA